MKANGLQDHRQGAAQGLARHHGLLRAPEDHRGRRLRLPARGGAGGRPCLTKHPAPRPSSLAEEFPPVPTAAWEAAIARDLKGADYEKKLVWRTEEGLAVRPYYRGAQRRGAELPVAARRRAGWEIAQEARPGPDAIRADLLHEAGAHAVQELGYALAAGVERLARLAEQQPLEPPPRRSSSSSRSARRTSSRSPSCAPRACCGRRPWRPSAASGEGAAAHAPARAHPAAQQEHLRPLHQPAARHHRGAVGGDRRLRSAHGRAVRLRRRTWRSTCSASSRRSRTWTRWPTRPAARTTSRR